MSTIKADTETCHEAVTLFAQLVQIQDVEAIQRYLAVSRPAMNGTMDAIIPHFMSISDIREGQRKGKFIIAVLEHMLAIRQLVEEQLAQDTQP